MSDAKDCIVLDAGGFIVTVNLVTEAEAQQVVAVREKFPSTNSAPFRVLRVAPAPVAGEAEATTIDHLAEQYRLGWAAGHSAALSRPTAGEAPDV